VCEKLKALDVYIRKEKGTKSVSFYLNSRKKSKLNPKQPEEKEQKLMKFKTEKH